jgi:alginate O-acetyltransferase complex protein AlgJ
MTLAGPTTPAPQIQRAAERAHPVFRGISRRILAMLFIAALFIPAVGAWRNWDPSGESHENRRLATRPSLPRNFKDATLYSDRWLNFYRDHFGFRNSLIRGVALTRFHGLGADIDGHVLVGRDGWLFLRADGDPNFIAFRGLNPFSEDDLDAWQHVLEQRAAWMAARGIPLLIVIAPNKETIYPEYLSDEVSPIRPPSRLDQLVERLQRTHSPVHFLDLRPTLMAAKSSGRLYFKTDTHWNEIGAYVGYRAMMDAVKDLLPKWNIIPQPRSNFGPGKEPFLEGDLARMMDMSDQYPDEWFSLARKIPFDVPPGTMYPKALAVTEMNDPTLPRLVFYHDSFAIALTQMIGPSFNRVFWSFNYEIDPKAIEREKPDLVIDEFLERNLYLDPPTDPPEIRRWNER